MSKGTSNPGDLKRLEGEVARGSEAAPIPAGRAIVAANTPARQLSELPKEELEALAEEYGLEPGKYKSRQHLVAALHDRRQMIAAMDREAMLDVARWGRRPITPGATKEQIAQEIVRIKSMRFEGLSLPALAVLARLRGVQVGAKDDVPAVVRRLNKQEGFFARLNRKRRAMLGALVSNMLGEADADSSADPTGTDAGHPALPDGRDTPATSGSGAAPTAGGGAQQQARSATIKEEIEEAGLFGGLAGRIKKTADQYLNQKLDEIEARIDRKLDEIDRRLAEWRDKEIANRIRIMKITLWASVIVAALSLIYSYVKVYWFHV